MERKQIGWFKIGDRVLFHNKDLKGTIVSLKEPKEPKGSIQECWCNVEWDKGEISISLDSRIFENENGNDTIKFLD